MSDYTPAATGSGARARVQRFGAFLAGMVMPNLGAFIAFGLVTALFIPTGWINTIAGTTENPLPITVQIGQLVGPLISILLPLLIGYTGGKMVYETRGAVVGAVATLGGMLSPVALQLVGIQLNADEPAAAPENIAGIAPNFLAAFILGPLTALLLKLWDRAIAGKVKGGFEMLVDNFSAGIIGGAMAVLGLYVVGWATFWVAQGLGAATNALVEAKLLPLVSIIVEPAKILFLNNALNHGVFTPLGAEQAAGEAGKSILFMLESNPGPGLGILTAMLLFGPRAIRPTVPAAMVVHFLGGIHEIYFPYVLMKPILVIAAIAGGATGVLWEVIWGLGLRAPASPGSVIAWILVSPPDNVLLNLVGIVLAAAVAALVGSALLKFGRGESAADEAMNLEAAQQKSAQNKAQSKNQPAADAAS
ncbi:PTS transporter subunit EIIC [Schumannella sp. 10F1B-5-1]|uniref:PTS transporter subunit EIIC n=1 Tax=Schumannella sp. 10F1B-5-1 TaxID=2590780 RepID=UPI00112FD271|nr:PTS transporter subunit EIIC [Schumannella sp. 10F1B-5-1]TPW71005.1 PTS mannitol transporter subunit IICB [Schumannella sp. 10F1B-5-1]